MKNECREIRVAAALEARKPEGVVGRTVGSRPGPGPVALGEQSDVILRSVGGPSRLGASG